MSTKTRNIIIIIAAAVMLLAAAAGVWAYISIQIEDARVYEYYTYNEDGTPNNITYRNNKGELLGSDDYITLTSGTQVLYHYDGEGNEIGLEMTEVNDEGNPTKYTKRENDVLVCEILYTYYEDGVTLKTKATKTFEGEDEHAVKEWYDEDGNVTETKNYLNNEEVK